jgi:cobalt-zinc-cadmium efflux system membrane fusion protein
MPNSDGRALPPRRQVVILARIVLIVAGIIVAVIVLRSLLAPREESAPAGQPGTFRPTPEQMAGLKLQPVSMTKFHSEIATDGKVAFDDDITTPVYSPYSGRVTRLIAKSGDVVARGAPLFAIDASEFAQAENDLITAAAALKTADAQLKLAQANEKRQHEVYEARGGALKDWLQSQADLVNAGSNQRTAQTALVGVRNRLRILGQSDREISAIEASPETAHAGPEVIVPAPIAGTVLQRQISTGQYIESLASGASSPALSIGDLSTVWLIGNVRELDVPAIHVGQPVEVKVLAYPDRVFKARLAYIGASVDDATRRIPVRAEVENPDGALKPEMFANMRIMTSDDSMVVSVPEDAVVFEGDLAHVWVARDDGLIALRPIRVGRRMDGLIEVPDGLKAGEKIVTSGTLFIDRAAQGD